MRILYQEPAANIIYTNGSSVCHLTGADKPSEIGHGKLIERVAALK